MTSRTPSLVVKSHLRFWKAVNELLDRHQTMWTSLWTFGQSSPRGPASPRSLARRDCLILLTTSLASYLEDMAAGGEFHFGSVRRVFAESRREKDISMAVSHPPSGCIRQGKESQSRRGISDSRAYRMYPITYLVLFDCRVRGSSLSVTARRSRAASFEQRVSTMC
jgi:hypothetical protein